MSMGAILRAMQRQAYFRSAADGRLSRQRADPRRDAVSMADWIFQSNPKRYDVHAAVAASRQDWWNTPRYRDRIDERGLIVTTAEFSREAVHEAAAEGRAKIGLLGGDALVRLCSERGIGVDRIQKTVLKRAS
jgi:Restriction endonuclease